MLEKPEPSTEKGFRDLLILCLLYDTGARVSELLNLTVGDIHFGRYARVQLTGKGNKSREVPLSTKTADLLKTYVQRQNLSSPERRTTFEFAREIFYTCRNYLYFAKVCA